MIINDLLKVRITFDEMRGILSWTHKEREEIIWDVMSSWFGAGDAEWKNENLDIKDIKTSELLKMHKNYAEFKCTYYGGKEEKIVKEVKDIHLSNPKIDTSFSKGSLSRWFSQIKNDVYPFYSAYIERMFENGLSTNCTTLVWDHFNYIVRMYIVNKLDNFYNELKATISDDNITKELLLWNNYYPVQLLSRQFKNHFEFFERIFSSKIFKKIFIAHLGKLDNNKKSILTID